LAELIKHQIDGPVGPPGCAAAEYVAYVGSGSDSEKLAMSTMGPLCPEQLTQEETLDEVCVGPDSDIHEEAASL